MVLARRIALIPRRRFGTGPGTFTNQGIKVFSEQINSSSIFRTTPPSSDRTELWTSSRNGPRPSELSHDGSDDSTNPGGSGSPVSTHLWLQRAYSSPSLLRHVLLDRMGPQVQPPRQAKEPRRVRQRRVNKSPPASITYKFDSSVYRNYLLNWNLKIKYRLSWK